MKSIIISMLLFTTVLSQQMADNSSGYHSCKTLTGFQSSAVMYPGDSTIDVTYYKLDLRVTTSPNYLYGEITVIAKSLSNGLSSFYLDLNNNMITESVSLGETPLLFNHSTNKLYITLDRSYSINEQFNVKIKYKGLPTQSGFGSFAFTTAGGYPAVWTLSQPYGAKDWWPCKDTPADKADSADIWIRCSSDLTAASNGILVDVVNNGDGTSTYKWKTRYPIAQYLIAMTIGKYTEYINYFHYSETDSMPVVHYVYPQSFNSNKDNLDKTPAMLEIFSEKYGLYPFINEKYGHVQFGWGGGMEHQTLSSMGGFSEGLVSHELAHQWFGDMVTCKDWHNIWLNEGFATYSEAVYMENMYDKAAYDNLIVSKMNSARTANGTMYVTDISSVNTIFNSALVYQKGAIILHMLRGIVGDSTFFNILKSYLTHPSLTYNVAEIHDFKSVAESVSGMDLSYFFEQWIYGVKYPSYSFGWNYTDAGNGFYNLTLKVNQAVNTSPSFFTMPIEFKVTTNIGDTTFNVFNNEQNQTFNVVVKGLPQTVQFDPGNWILKNVTILDTNEELLNPNEFYLSQNYPNPFNPATLIKFSVPSFLSNSLSLSHSLVTIKVYDVLGNEVATLLNENKTPGVYEVEFNGAGLASGIYIYRLQINPDRTGEASFTASRKMLLMK